MPNHTWSLDFMSYTLYGHCHRLLNVINEGTREALGIVAGTSLCSGRVVRELNWSWLISYNEERPHAALRSVPPMEFKRQILAGMSSLELCA